MIPRPGSRAFRPWVLYGSWILLAASTPSVLDCQGRVAEFRKSSERIRQRVAESLRAGEAPAMQPAIFQGMGLENMLTLGATGPTQAAKV